MKIINNKKRGSLFWYGLLLLIFFFSLHSCATDPCIVTDMTASLSEKDKKLLEVFGAGWMKEAKVCYLGGYMIAAPADGSKGTLFVMVSQGVTS